MSRESKQSRFSCEEKEDLNTNQRFTAFLSGLDLPNNPNQSYDFTNTSINNQNPAYLFYSLMFDRITGLAAISKLTLENNQDLTNETLFYLMVIPDIAKHLEIIKEVDYNSVKSLYQDLFKTLSELESSSDLAVNYDLVNSQIETLRKAGLNIDSITRSVQENSLSR